MKRLTTKLFAVVCGCLVSMGAWAADAIPSTTLDIRATIDDPTAMETNGWVAKSQSFNYAIATDTIVFHAYLCYQSQSKQLWIGSTGAGSTSATWSATNVFKGNTAWNVATAATTRDSRIYYFQVTNCVGALACINTKGKGTQTLAAYEVVGGTVSTTPAESASYTTDATGVAEISGLDKTKTYRIQVNSDNTNNSQFYEIAFVAAAASPTIKSFTAEGVAATIANDTISAELPYGTDLTSITPTVILGGSAKGYSPTGAQDFSNSATAGSAVEYIVSDSAISPTTKTYKVILTAATTASSEKTLSDVTIGGESVELIGNAGSIVLSKSADLSALAVTFEIPATAGADFTSGSTFDFISNSLTITVQAQDGSTAVYTLSASKGTKDILYLTISSAEDLFLNQLKAKGYYVITRAGQSTAPANYDGIDLVVLHESLSGSDGSGTTKELALIKDVDVPILNTKSYFYTAGSSPRWGWGTANNGNSQTYVTLNTAVYSNVASHPIFAGLTIDKDTTIILGTETAKNIQPIASFESGYEGYSLATVPAGCAIHELSATARLTSGTSKYLLVSILSSKFNDLTANGLTLLDNACNYLMGSDVWTPVLVSTSLAETSIWGVSYVNGIIRNSNGVTLQVYNATGKLVATGMENIDMNGFAAGVYVVRSNNGALKIVK